MRALFLLPSLLLAPLLTASEPASAGTYATLTRIDADRVALSAPDTAGLQIWISDDTIIDDADTLLTTNFTDGDMVIDMPATRRAYVLLKAGDKAPLVVGERVLPLQQASNFRDVGGYKTGDGRAVKWGRVYRSGAMPLLTEADYSYIDQLALDSIIDFRSLDEREVIPNMVDDRTGALFIANDYAMAPMMKAFRESDGENTYAGMEVRLRPQYRAVFKRIAAGDGAVLYHCSAGQDRTGVATALLYDVLGVDRDTIIQDYHLSTELRQTQWEMPEVDPADYPGNFLVGYYVAARKAGKGPQPLYTPSGQSHMVQFFAYIDREFGSSEAYLTDALGLTATDIAAIRQTMLD